MSFFVGMGGSRTVGSKTAGLVGSVELVGGMVVGWVVEVGWISAAMEASSRVVWSGSSSFSSCFTGGGVVVGREGWSGSELEEVGLGGSADIMASASRKSRSTLRGRREMKCGSQVKMDVRSSRDRSTRC